MGATLKYNFTEILAFHVFISEYKRFPQWELNIDPSEPGIFMENVLVRAVFLCFYLLLAKLSGLSTVVDIVGDVCPACSSTNLGLHEFTSGRIRIGPFFYYFSLISIS